MPSFVAEKEVRVNDMLQVMDYSRHLVQQCVIKLWLHLILERRLETILWLKIDNMTMLGDALTGCNQACEQ